MILKSNFYNIGSTGQVSDVKNILLAAYTIGICQYITRHIHHTNAGYIVCGKHIQLVAGRYGVYCKVLIHR